jgi:SSS family solute:Na+ symporter
MNIIIFATLLFSLQLIYWVIGRIGSKNLKNKKDYYLAGKRVSFFPLMMTLLATQVGGGLIVGSADEAFRYGWYVLFYPMGAGLGLVILGLGVGKKLSMLGVSTVSQIFEKVYGSKFLKYFSSALSILSLFFVLVAMVVASQKFLLALGFDNLALFLVYWAIVVIYTSRGGLRAVISTDIAQAVVFTVFLFICFFKALSSPSFATAALPSFENFSLVSSKLYGWLLMPLFFMLIEQDIAQRCFAGASPKVVSRAAFWAGIILLCICGIPVFFGVLAKTVGLTIPEGSSVLMTTITSLTGPWIGALAGCAILAAIISTATSQINAISSNVANDFSEKMVSIPLIRGITATIAICALFAAFSFRNVVDLLILSYELSVCGLLVPVVFALFREKQPLASGITSVAFGIFGFVFFRIVPVPFPKEVLSILLSLVGFGLGALPRVTFERRGA